MTDATPFKKLENLIPLVDSSPGQVCGPDGCYVLPEDETESTGEENNLKQLKNNSLV